MARELFVDASAWIALADAQDTFHQKAIAAFPRLLAEYHRVVTTNLVVAESYVTLRTRVSLSAALGFLERLRTSQRFLRIDSDSELESEAELLLRRYNDHDFSLADAVSFVVMRERDITDVFTFDHHFDILRFHRIP